MTKSLPSTSLAAFLATFRDSGIVDGVTFDKIVSSLPSDAENGLQAAQFLVNQLILTPFQGERLLSGRSDGFNLGQYIILEPLGKGPSSKVFKAKHRTMNRLVAVKVLEPKVVQQPAQRDAVMAEARAWAALAHPHVVTMLDINTVGERLYMVLEYIQGTTLETAVKSNKKGTGLPYGKACEYARQLALGLVHTHEKGQIHGVLNPSNILLGTSGGKSTTDRPMAKLHNNNQTTLAKAAGVAEITCYIPPERIAQPQEPPTPAGDWYSLGAVMYFMLSGRPPAPVHKTGLVPDPLPLAQFRPDIPAPVLDVVNKLMHHDAQYRPSNGHDVAAWLEPFAEHVDAAVDYNAFLTTSHTATVISNPVTTPAPPNQGFQASNDWSDPWSGLEFSQTQTQDNSRMVTPVVVPNVRNSVAPTAAPRRYRTESSASQGLGLIIGIIIAIILATLLSIGLVIRYATK